MSGLSSHGRIVEGGKEDMVFTVLLCSVCFECFPY